MYDPTFLIWIKFWYKNLIHFQKISINISGSIWKPVKYFLCKMWIFSFESLGRSLVKGNTNDADCWLIIKAYFLLIAYLARMRHRTSCKEMLWAKGTGLTTHPVERPTWEIRLPRGAVKSWRFHRSAISSKCVELAIITMIPGHT